MRNKGLITGLILVALVAVAGGAIAYAAASNRLGLRTACGVTSGRLGRYQAGSEQEIVGQEPSWRRGMTDGIEHDSNCENCDQLRENPANLSGRRGQEAWANREGQSSNREPKAERNCECEEAEHRNLEMKHERWTDSHCECEECNRDDHVARWGSKVRNGSMDGQGGPGSGFTEDAMVQRQRGGRA